MAKFQCNFISYALQRTVDITVVVPSVTISESLAINGRKPTHKTDEKYPALYLLHGMGNNHATWGGYSNVELYAEENHVAVIMLSGENKFYRTEGNSDDYFKFVADEAREFVTNYFPISSEPEHSYIAGLSMGGYGALLHGLTHPDRFAGIGAFSPASPDIRMVDEPEKIKDLVEGPIEVKCLLSDNITKNRKMPPVYLACGEKDLLYDLCKKYRQLLSDGGVEVKWVSLPQYNHEWRFWDIQAEEFIKWLPRTEGYAAEGSRGV